MHRKCTFCNVCDFCTLISLDFDIPSFYDIVGKINSPVSIIRTVYRYQLHIQEENIIKTKLQTQGKAKSFLNDGVSKDT